MSHICVFAFVFSLQQTPFPLNLAHLISVNVKWKNKEVSTFLIIQGFELKLEVWSQQNYVDMQGHLGW